MVDKTKYLEKFKELYRKKNGSDLSDADALELFEQLIVLVDTVYKPIPKNSYAGR